MRKLLLNAEDIPCALRSRRWTLAPAGRPAQTHFFFIAGGAAAVALGSQRPAILESPAIVWVPPGTGDFVEFAAGASGATFSADDAALRRTIEAGADAQSLRRLWNRPLSVCGAPVASIRDELRISLCALAREAQAPRRDSAALSAAHVTIVLLHLWRTAGAALSAVARDDRSAMIQRFLELVEIHFLEHWSVARYARELNLHHDRLHAACIRLTGRGPLAHVHSRSIDEARKRLVKSGAPVEAIAAELGFADPGYFNRFFKRHVGESPGLYRRRMLAAMFEATSFAAWP